MILCHGIFFTHVDRSLLYIIANWIFADISECILKNRTSGEDGGVIPYKNESSGIGKLSVMY